MPRATTLNREFAREIRQLEKIDDHGRTWSTTHYIGGYSSYSSLTNLHQTSPNFAELERLLRPHVRRFARRAAWDLMGKEIRMTTCWVNRMGQGTYHGLHLHPLSVLSGVYYVDAPKGSSPFKIEDPLMGQLMAAPPRPNYLLIPPRAGGFLLFESWLRHEVPPHRIAKPRLSISFNYEWTVPGSL